MDLKLLGLATAFASISVPAAARAQCGHDSYVPQCAAVEEPPRFADAPPAGAKMVRVVVNEDGFSPSEIRIGVGERVILEVTRTTNATCAKEIVIPEYEVRRALPLDQPVSIELTGARAGAVRYACGMDMVAGTLLIE